MAAPLKLEQVLLEEERAWQEAVAIAEVARRQDLDELAKELTDFRSFLGADFEVHLDREEVDLFPQLAARGLEAEVEQAKVQHAELRALRDLLACVPPGDIDMLRGVLLQISDAMHRHVRYESDFLYCDLTEGEASDFRAYIDQKISDSRRPPRAAE